MLISMGSKDLIDFECRYYIFTSFENFATKPFFASIGIASIVLCQLYVGYAIFGQNIALLSFVPEQT